MGTVNLLECIRLTSSVKSFINVTTDKVYENKEWPWGYREIDSLNGHDPYSNSKACSDLITQSYQKSFFQNSNISVSIVRAGNVIGGGDFSKDRIIPDCVKAVINGQNIQVRNPESTRPYQHVLEPLMVYLMSAQAQFNDKNFSGIFNVGPNEEDFYSTGDLVDLFVKKWGGNVKWNKVFAQSPHETHFLKLDCSRLKRQFNWKPRWHLDLSMEKTVEWYKKWNENGNVSSLMIEQISQFGF
jgi:CDP-glucose 4,6-dehydratase